MLSNGHIINENHTAWTSERVEYTQQLVQLFITQLTQGCGDESCPASTCFSHRKAHATRPLRRFTPITARAAAIYLASLDNALGRLCPLRTTGTLEGNDSDTGATIESSPLNGKPPVAKKDPKSFSQLLFDTEAVKDFVERGNINPHNGHDSTFQDEEDHKTWQSLRYLGISISCGSAEDIAAAWVDSAKLIVGRVPALPENVWVHEPLYFHTFSSTEKRKLVDCFQNVPARRLSLLLAQVLAKFSHSLTSKQAAKSERAKIILKHIEGYLMQNGPAGHSAEVDDVWRLVRSLTSASKINGESASHCETQWPKPVVKLDGDTGLMATVSPLGIVVMWFQRVFMDSWDGSLILSGQSVARDALMSLNVLFEMTRQSLSLDWLDRELFVLDPVAQRLDPHNVAHQLLHKSGQGMALPKLPWLFSPRPVWKNFRALCYFRMLRSVEQVRLYVKSINEGMYWMAPDSPHLDHLMTDRLRVATSTFFAINIRRDNILHDTFAQLWQREKRELERPLRVSIVNEGEEGQDQGGVAQELFSLVFAKVFAPEYGMFVVDPRTKMTWFDPKSLEPNYKFETLGVLMALAIYNGFTLPVTFPLALYAKLIGPPWDDIKNIADIEDGWPELASGLSQLLSWDEGDVEEVFSRSYAFSFEAYGDVVHVDMTKTSKDDPWSPISAMVNSKTDLEDAPLVTSATRVQFVEDYIYWLTNKSVRAQFKEFARGFRTLIDAETLKMFLPQVLGGIVEGESEIDVDALRLATSYDGYSSSDRIIQDFWDILENEYDNDKLKKLLEFVTASDRLPVTGARGVDFVVQKNGSDGEAIPGAMTCFGRLLLPEYASKDKLRIKLGIALDNATGFGVR